MPNEFVYTTHSSGVGVAPAITVTVASPTYSLDDPARLAHELRSLGVNLNQPPDPVTPAEPRSGSVSFETEKSAGYSEQDILNFLVTKKIDVLEYDPEELMPIIKKNFPTRLSAMEIIDILYYEIDRKKNKTPILRKTKLKKKKKLLDLYPYPSPYLNWSDLRISPSNNSPSNTPNTVVLPSAIWRGADTSSDSSTSGVPVYAPSLTESTPFGWAVAPDEEIPF